jgi:enoyl-CoA hydratase/carnithine racemase
MASTIASHSPLVVQGTKKVLNYSDEHSLEDGLEYVALWNTSFLRSEDLTEAVTSFISKQPPKFRNKL